MFESLRTSLARRAIRHWLSTAQRKRAVHNLNTAKTVGILFEASNEKIRKEATEWAEQLTKQGKKVKLLGFFNTPKPPVEAPAYDSFFAKETGFNYQPSAAKVKTFIQESFDILLDLNFTELPALAWAAAQSKAAMKIGRTSNWPCDHDLQLDLPAERGIKQFATQLQPYLDTLVVAK
jgi:hypothetical protein